MEAACYMLCFLGSFPLANALFLFSYFCAFILFTLIGPVSAVIKSVQSSGKPSLQSMESIKTERRYSKSTSSYLLTSSDTMVHQISSSNACLPTLTKYLETSTSLAQS